MKGNPEWARIYGRMAASKEGRQVPPPTEEWHEPDATFYPGLAAHPFWWRSDPWWCERVQDAVDTLERFYPIIKQEL